MSTYAIAVPPMSMSQGSSPSVMLGRVPVIFVPRMLSLVSFLNEGGRVPLRPVGLGKGNRGGVWGEGGLCKRVREITQL